MRSDCVDHGKAGHSKKGYANVRVADGHMNQHRLVYMEAHGLQRHDLTGLVVRHTCDNTRCINPEHLIIGTTQDNVDDKVRRGRQLRGVTIASSIATDLVVKEIRRRYKPHCKVDGGSALGREFGLSQPTVSQIVRGETWQHV